MYMIPNSMSLEQYIRRRVDTDPITIQDQETMRKKWGVKFKPKVKARRRGWNVREREEQKHPVSGSLVKTPREETITRLLWVQNKHFTAAAVFRRISGAWSCQHAAPILRWMVGKGMGEIKVELLRLGAKWEWLERKDGP